MSYTESLKLYNEAKEIIPLASQTFSKCVWYFPLGAAPTYIVRGEGSHVWDKDENEYIDYICGLGPITLGHNYPPVDNAIRAQLRRGITFSLPHPLEYWMARTLIEVIPCAEMVRFYKTGSEACQAVIRAARAYTQRDHIAFYGYHGWHEWYAGTTERPMGVPHDYRNYIHNFEDKLDVLENILSTYPCAAVIMEPVCTKMPEPGFLEQIKELAHAYGALLIFDEVVTGFRIDLGGAQKYFNVIPDLSTFGKGCANGMPLCGVVGREDIMRQFDEIFCSGTFSGETLSLVAGLITIEEMRSKHTIEYIGTLGDRLMCGLLSIRVPVIGYRQRPVLQFQYNQEELSIFQQEMLKRGVLTHTGAMNLCFSHSPEDIDKTLNVFEDVTKGIRDKRFKLEGGLVKPAFKRL